VNTNSPDYKAPFNQIGNTARVFTPNDSAFRTQLFDEQDLSRYLGQPAPPSPAAIAWPRPQAGMSDRPALFHCLNFMLALCCVSICRRPQWPIAHGSYRY
jgi:hypothetical protein